MHNTKNFTLKLALFLCLFLGNMFLLNAQRTADGYKTTSCGNETKITYGNGNIIMEGKMNVNYTFKILDNRRKTIFECKENCGNSQEVAELPAGRYRIIIKNEKGRRICRRWIRLKRAECLAKSGQLEAIERRVILSNEMATLEAVTIEEPTVPDGFSKIYLLTSGEDLTIIDLDTTAIFTVNKINNYRIHTLVIETTSIDLDDLIDTETSVYFLKRFLKGNKNNFCSALDIKGAKFRVRIPNGPIDTGTGSGVGSSRFMCNGIQIFQEANILTISSEESDGYFFKINDKENHLANVFICRDDCEGEEIALELPNSTYLLSVYNKRGRRLCKETIVITEPNNENEINAEGRSQTHFSLAAHRVQRTVALEWLTNTGYKVSHFELEHSLNGVDFTKIEDFVNEDWSSEMAYHESTDRTPALGMNYYRVKQVFVDDSFKYSPIQQINFSTDLEKTAVFPNPAREALYVNMKQYLGTKGQLTLSNQFGQLVQQINLENIEQEIVTINTADIENGVYYLNIQVDGYRVLSEKVLVQRFY